jgi:hypothetical protein
VFPSPATVTSDPEATDHARPTHWRPSEHRQEAKGSGKGVDHHLAGNPAVDSDELGVGTVVNTARHWWAGEHLADAISCVAGLVLSVGCVACGDTTSGAGRSAEVKRRPVLADSCRSAVRPKDALREITAQLELAVWEDPICNALNVEIVNLSPTPLRVWDEKLRWAVEDDQLRVEPVPEQSAGQPRSYNRGCCQQLIVDKGKWAVLPPLGSFRWSEPLHDVETDDTRALCDGFAPSFYDAPLIFSSVSVVVSAFPLDGFPSRPPYQVDALCALRTPIEVRAFERQLPVEYWRE